MCFADKINLIKLVISFIIITLDILFRFIFRFIIFRLLLGEYMHKTKKKNHSFLKL